MNPLQNRRILLIDDMPSIHEAFRGILAAAPTSSELDAAEAALFGQAAPPSSPSCCDFELDTAYQGQEGVAMVEAAVQAGRPYAMAFVDMRMPPGWDGVETIERLWRIDPLVQIVICTAYSDYSWEELLARLDVLDRLLILKKPFDIIEVSQMVRALTTKWELTRQSALRMNSLEEAVHDFPAIEAALRQSNKELEAFSYSVAHDLRAPLNTIDGFSQLLQKTVSGDTAECSEQYLSRIRAGVRQMGELVDGLLSLARVTRTHLKAETVDLTAMAERVLKDCRVRDAGRTAQVHVERDLTATGDPALLRQVMENLLANAWKFTAHTATPKIEVGKFHDDNGAAVYFVRDNGAGFDMAHADKLFGAFQRLHSPSEFAGTGIGLATVDRIVSHHAGRIWAKGAVGQGATFFFTLPSASRQHPPSERYIDSQENRSAP